MSTSETTNKPLPPPHEVIVISDYPEDEERLRQQCIDVRRAVFCAEQGFSVALNTDENDATATHLLLRLTPSLTPIGTLRLYRVHDASYLMLGRVSILSVYRKYGLGKVLMQAAHERVVREPYLIPPSPAVLQKSESIAKSGVDEELQSRPTITVKIGSQLYSEPFYARLGYTPEGNTYIEQGAPHQPMTITLPIPTC
ncbi:acyl-CoA N-acyltransferase [Peniophora sp. CONT]|nr:acyl-CoA N-acyltransferase [Peniophora sp. CONT]